MLDSSPKLAEPSISLLSSDGIFSKRFRLFGRSVKSALISNASYQAGAFGAEQEMRQKHKKQPLARTKDRSSLCSAAAVPPRRAAGPLLAGRGLFAFQDPSDENEIL